MLGTLLRCAATGLLSLCTQHNCCLAFVAQACTRGCVAVPNARDFKQPFDLLQGAIFGEGFIFGHEESVHGH
jgi:hypothetical protein